MKCFLIEKIAVEIEKEDKTKYDRILRTKEEFKKEAEQTSWYEIMQKVTKDN